MKKKKTSSLPPTAILLGTMGIAIKPEGESYTVELLILSCCLATLHCATWLYKSYRRNSNYSKDPA